MKQAVQHHLSWPGRVYRLIHPDFYLPLFFSPGASPASSSLGVRSLRSRFAGRTADDLAGVRSFARRTEPDENHQAVLPVDGTFAKNLELHVSAADKHLFSLQLFSGPQKQ